MLGGDCNASVGSRVTGCVGPLAAEQEDAPGKFLHTVLADPDLWLPATFDWCHEGPTHTYTHKNGKLTCRPDFVAIPASWSAGETLSWCEPRIHAAHATPDHVAACVRVNFCLSGARAGTSHQRRTLPLSSITDPQCREQAAEVLRSAPEVGWSVSVHAHAAILAKHVQDGIAAIASRQQTKPHHPYITESTWELQRSVARTRRELHRLTAQIAHHTLAASFRAWCARTSFQVAHGAAQAWFERADSVRCQLQSDLKGACAKLRKACRSDRDAYISRLAADIAHAPSKEAYAAVHRVLMHRRKKPFSLDPLPMLKRADGSACADATELKELWRAHFAKLEAGRCTELDSFPAYIGVDQDWTCARHGCHTT